MICCYFKVLDTVNREYSLHVLEFDVPSTAYGHLRQYIWHIIEKSLKGVNSHLKDATQTKQRPQSPTVVLTWHVSEYKVHKLHQIHTHKGYRYIFVEMG